VIQAGARRLRNWLIGTIRGELSTSGLDGVRTAGASAYSLAEEAERLRLEPGWDPWRQDTRTQLFLVCAWNAFALQTTADRLLEADAAADPLTAELVPVETLAFAQDCYAQVMTWVQSARFAQANTAYRVTKPLPAALPTWPRIEQTRSVHVRALKEAYEAVAPRAEYELGRLVQTAASEHAHELAEMNLLHAQMRTSVELARTLESHAQSHPQLQEARDDLVRALGCAYTLGQLVAMPSLVERLQLAGFRAVPSTAVPLTAIGIGWQVVDRDGTPIGRVIRVEGEPAVGSVTALVISIGAQFADRRVRIDQLHAVERGVVRVAAGKADLERA
jgi:hypothetical protein